VVRWSFASGTTPPRGGGFNNSGKLSRFCDTSPHGHPRPPSGPGSGSAPTGPAPLRGSVSARWVRWRGCVLRGMLGPSSDDCRCVSAEARRSRRRRLRGRRCREYLPVRRVRQGGPRAGTRDRRPGLTPNPSAAADPPAHAAPAIRRHAADPLDRTVRTRRHTLPASAVTTNLHRPA